MGKTTGIEWTDATWNPLRGCSMAKGSESGGCLNCYAAATALRYSNVIPAESGGRPMAFHGFAVMRPSGPRWTGKVELIESRLADPLKWRKPQRIFVNSMSDLFHESVSDSNLLRIFTVMGNTHIATGIGATHTLQCLTKRAARMSDFCIRLRWKTGFGFTEIGGRTHIVNDMPYLVDLDNPWVSLTEGQAGAPFDRGAGWMPENIWLGVSVENQAMAEERIPLLLQTPAAVRFVSYEPALGPVDFTGFPPGLRWIIVGGESGTGARPFNVRWARSVVEQCHKSGVACFVKQLGAKPGIPSCADFKCTHPDCGVQWLDLKDRKGGDISEWPADLRVREFPRQWKEAA